MRFKRRLKIEQGLNTIDIAPIIDVVLLLLIFFILTSSFAAQAGINVKFPRTVTSDIIKEENLLLIISSENVLYLDNTIVTFEELRKELSHYANSNRSLLIKADRRSSVGRIVEIWNLCRRLGIEKINIATN